MKKIAITGATGFIGKNVCEELQRRGMPFIRLIREPKYDNDRFYDLSQQILDTTLLDDVKTVVHIAAYVHKKNDNLAYKKYNIEASKLLFELALKKNVNVVFISTVGVYGKNSSRELINENSRVSPQNDYAKSKLESEYYLNELYEKFKLEYSIFRLPIVIGMDAKGSYGLLNKITNLISVLPLKNCNSKRSILSVSIFSEYLANFLEKGVYHNRPVIIKNDKDVSIKDIIKSISRKKNRKMKFVYVPKKLYYYVMKSIGMKKLYEQLFEPLCFKASVNLETKNKDILI